MYSALFVIYAIIAAVTATPIYVHECGILDSPLATYALANDIKISNLSYGHVCLDIKGNGITLDGNGFQLSSASGLLLPGTGVQYSGTGATVTNLRVSHLRTAIHANAKFGKVHSNTITRAVNGIDVTATNNEIYNNIIKDFEAADSASGIYVYFPAMSPVDSSISITNNIISDIQGENFVLGISVYYATSVYIAHNQIYNLQAVLSEEISVINGQAKLVDNVFAPTDVVEYSTATLLVSGLALLASIFYYHFYYTSSSSPVSLSSPVSHVELKSSSVDEDDEEDDEEEEEEKEETVEETKLSEEEVRKRKEKEIFDKDGADDLKMKRLVSWHIGSSPSMT